MLNEIEVKEIEYMIKRELEELLLDLSDPRIDRMIKHAMEEKYHIIFGIYKRLASPKETMQYIINRSKDCK